MIYDDRHLFVALPKCASSFVEIFLVEQCGWSKVDPRPLWSWNHRPLCSAPAEVLEGRQAFAVMRDPWSFYQSLYRYPNRWGETGWSGFHEWLQLLLDGKPHLYYRPWQKIDVDLFRLLAQWDIGMLTFNYILQCAENSGPFLAGKVAPKDVELGVHIFQFTTDLRKGMIDYLPLTREQRELLRRTPDENVSTEPVEDYTPELVDLVAHKERLIVERFHYTYEEAAA